MKQQQKTVTFWIVLLLIMMVVFKVVNEGKTRHNQITYSKFLEAVEAKNVGEVNFQIGTNIITGKYIGTDQAGKQISFRLVGDTSEQTFKLLQKHGITPNYLQEEKQGLLTSLLINWGPMILLIVIFYFFLRQIQSGGGKAMSFGKSRAKMLSASDKKITFDDVAGVQEAKEELEEVVDFLKEPKKYTALGGKIPKGVILVGPPGTGKTLLARAVAGEADVPFFSISGSDFVEMFVGVGASRVRDLFEQGKKNAPCIIFIDEIDAVGRHRGAGMGGGHDEREQTLNQLLVEMDGFEANEGVILVAATNRIDVLDPALLRPGRFDRRVTVDRPDVRGRLGILKVHSKNTPLANGVDLQSVAKGTPGFTGADLANLVNEAALHAARLNKIELSTNDFEFAKDKVLMGPERKSLVISDAEKRITAFHEAGHTLVGMNLPHTDPIHKVSIMPRGGALGVTQTLPDEDKLSLSRGRCESFLAFLMGGRCAEDLVFDEITSGAANDIERATSLSRNMTCHWGMSPKLGPVNFHKTGMTAFADGRGEQTDYSEETARTIDGEVNRLITAAYEQAMDILKENRKALDDLSEALIVWETLNFQQVKDVIEGKDIGIPEIKVDDEKDDENKKDEAKVKEETVAKDITKEGEPGNIAKVAKEIVNE